MKGGCLKPTRLKPCMTYDDPVVLPIHAPRRCEPLITLWLWGCARTSAIGGHLPKPDLARAKGELSRYICWQPWVWNLVPTPAGTIGGQWLGRACLPICGAVQVTCGQRGGNSYRGVVGFHGKWLPSRGWLPRARALASVLWRGVRNRGRKGRRPKIPTAA